MRDPRKAVFGPYLLDLADRMGLRDWKVLMSDDPPGEDAHADVKVVGGRRRAIVRLSEEFLDDGPEEQRHTLVHELLHCQFDAAAMIALDSMPEEVHPAFRRMFEHGIDGTADFLAPPLPLMEEDEVEQTEISIDSQTE